MKRLYITPVQSLAKGGVISMNPDGTFKVLKEGKATVTIAFGKYKVKAKVVVAP